MAHKLVLTLLSILILNPLVWADSSALENQCEIKQVSINLFQLHHRFDSMGQCLQWQTRSEPNFIENNIPSRLFPQYQDQASWQAFDHFEFCYDQDHPEKLQALISALDEKGFLSFPYRNLKYQFGILNSLAYNVSRALTKSFAINQNGIFYYTTVEENFCSQIDLDSGALNYPNRSLDAYEQAMTIYYQLIEIVSHHFDVIEQHSFLPEPLQHQN